jgi:hypothetical protein
VRSTRARAATAAIAGFALLLTACGGSDTSSATSTSAAPTTEAPTTTAAPPTTDESTTTTVVEGPTQPLTGLPLSDPAAATREAMVVKIDNHPDARPQFGLNQADIVFEENVENLTRFAAVFQGTVPDRVGPVRSGRTQDVNLLGSLASPMFVWSGGNPTVTKAIRNSDLINLSPTATGNEGFFRQKRGGEAYEHTLYARPPDLWAGFSPPDATAPPEQFTYRDAGTSPAGVPSAGVDIKMDNVNVGWTWDAASSSYLRTMGGRAHNDATLGQVNAANVVVLVVDYKQSPADPNSPEAQTLGTGKAVVFAGGNLVAGTWSRADRLDPFTLTADDGSTIELTPGRTWVELARAGKTAPR